MKATQMSSPIRATNRTGESNSELQEEIRRRAYELYERRGQGDGHDLEDWLEAEAELTGTRTNSVAA